MRALRKRFVVGRGRDRGFHIDCWIPTHGAKPMRLKSQHVIALLILATSSIVVGITAHVRHLEQLSQRAMPSGRGGQIPSTSVTAEIADGRE
jgi:hypothetical protein